MPRPPSKGECSVIQSRSGSTQIDLLGVLLLTGPDLPEVELELLALKNVAVSTTGLAWPAGDAGVETAGSKLALKESINLGLLALLVQVTLSVVRQLFLLSNFSSLLLRALLGHGLSVVSLVPLTEGGSIDLNDGALDEGVRADQLVVRGVVDDSENTGLARRVLAGPGEVAGLQTEGTVLEVSSTDTNSVNALGADLGVGGLTAELELALLAVVGALSTRGRTFVPGGTGDTYRSRGRP